MDILRRQCIKFEKDVADHEKKQEEFAAYKTTVSRMIAGLEKEKDDFVDALTEREQVYVAQIQALLEERRVGKETMREWRRRVDEDHTMSKLEGRLWNRRLQSLRDEVGEVFDGTDEVLRA